MKRRTTSRKGGGGIIRQLQAENSRLRAELQSLQHVRDLAYRDALTGLRNRRYFDERMAEELSRSRRHRTCGGLILVDLDDFKQVNDAHGHLAGDRLLQRLARFLEETLRTEDVVCRVGGDEFMVILPDADEPGAVKIASRLQEQLALASQWSGSPISVSLGAAAWPLHGCDLEALVERADHAMYRDKARRKAGHVPVNQAA
ncbi:MAG: GGDEF domain-containing protein [Deltaproteobacteria bacterium]|nr:GGDEF domain-containing protein [Deltaproteobacteria bacterium]